MNSVLPTETIWFDLEQIIRLTGEDRLGKCAVEDETAGLPAVRPPLTRFGRGQIEF